MSKGYDIAEFVGEVSGKFKVPGKVGYAITALQLGDKLFMQDYKGMWIEVAKVGIGTSVGGFTVLAGEGFIEVGKYQAGEIAVNLNQQALYLHRRGVNAQRNGHIQAANTYFERSIKLQKEAKELAYDLLEN